MCRQTLLYVYTFNFKSFYLTLFTHILKWNYPWSTDQLWTYDVSTVDRLLDPKSNMFLNRNFEIKFKTKYYLINHFSNLGFNNGYVYKSATLFKVFRYLRNTFLCSTYLFSNKAH